MRLFRNLFKTERTPPTTPPDSRIYAIGDVHGRLDLLLDLLDEIQADRRARPCATERVVFLGDLIDRGPHSCGVLQLLSRNRANLPDPVFLMGNHEEMLLRVLGADEDSIFDWLSFGGYEFAESYGVEVDAFATCDAATVARMIRAVVPERDLAFIASFADSFRFGDYLFVHAGIKPGVALEDQKAADMRWIRETFLDSTVQHPAFVIHGHTISQTPDERPNRIGIDTGAYASGLLTAICLEGNEHRYITAKRPA
ncbi:metallophosphoesterase [Sphingomonas echinoides]|uniref:metallophosphoesterase n=1 Tax=Sphingomonas echinoides TaxID=59803 RepID=UPI0024139B7C|nr:metallophosphoesterase [Sphingomonas echinoides]